MNVDWGHDRVSDGTSLVADIPATAWCLRHDQVAQRLAEAAPALRLDRRSSCRIVGLIAEPPREVEVGYELQGQAGRSIVTVRYARPGKSAKVYERALAVASDPAAVIHLPALDAVAWRYPEDEGLPHLSRLEHVRWLRAERAEAGAVSDAAPWAISVLSYRRGSRCTVMAVSPGRERVVIKMQPGAAEAHARVSALYARRDPWLAMPRPLGVDAEHALRWEGWVEGVSVMAAAKARGMTSVVGQVATMLGALHSSAIDGLPRTEPDSILRRLDRVTFPRMARAGLPAEQECRRVADRLGRCVPRWPAQPSTLHGDLHAGNVLIDGDRAALVDCDGVAMGDAALDLAMFASRLLLVSAIDVDAPPDTVQAVCDLPSLCRARGHVVDAEAFAWYVAALLVARQIKTCINHAAPNLVAVTDALAAASHDIVDRGRCEGTSLAHLLRPR